MRQAGQVVGTVVAVVPPGRGTGADEEPEHAGGAAVEEDGVVWMHDGVSMAGGGFIAEDDDSVRRWAGMVPRILAMVPSGFETGVQLD